jgi:hypothetical protein
MTNNHLHHSCANNSYHVEEETYTKQNCMNNIISNIAVQTTSPQLCRQQLPCGGD